MFKLKYADVADLFNVTVPVIERAYINAKKDLDETSKPNGRPFSLSKSQIDDLGKWMKSQDEAPHIKQVKTFIANEVGRDLDNKTYNNALSKAGLKTETAEGIEADRYYCSPSSIDYYYSMLESYFLTYDIPSPFVFNVDEEGHDEYVDTKKKELHVVPQDNTKKLRFPIERKDDHTTFVACIASDGSYLKPLIVVKRKTVEARILRTSLWNKLVIQHEETGYVNSEVFNAWVKKVFIPEVRKRRLEFNYTGPAVLIIDGCPSHYTEVLFESCNQNNIKIFFIPPHSSNQTQMLDLGTFHSHKENVRSARLFEITNDDLLVDKINMLFNSFHIAASHKNITKSFETAGAVFEPGIHGMPIVRFSIDFTTQIWHEHRTASEKAEIREKRKGKGQVETRIGIDDFNDISAYWENRNVEKAIEKMPKIIDYSESDPFHKLLCSFIPLDKNDIKELNPKIDIRRGRPKKDDTKKALKDKAKVCTYLTDYTFEQRLNLELESVGLDKK